MRFCAPAREHLSHEVANHPIFREILIEWPDVFGPNWPDVASLNLAPIPTHRSTGRQIRFLEQDAALLADGKHYEQRIRDDGIVATRPANWHDLFNALIWRRQPGLKSAVNARYASDFPAGLGRTERSRGQMALTLFDEGGVVVVTECREIVSAWNQHDWVRVFADPDHPWAEHVRLHVFGHALLEHSLVPNKLLVGKALLVHAALKEPSVLDRVAHRIATSKALRDPAELRPIPLSGIPGWFLEQGASFYRDAPCFRPLSPGRCYPVPIDVTTDLR